MKKHLLFIGALFVLSSTALGMNNNQVSSRQGEDDILKIILSFIGGDQYTWPTSHNQHYKNLSTFPLKDLKKIRMISKKFSKLVTNYVNKFLQYNWIDRNNMNAFNGEYTPLMLATINNNHDLIKLCLDLGSDREIVTGGLQTAYDLAKDYTSKEILKPWHVVRDVANAYLDKNPMDNVLFSLYTIACLSVITVMLYERVLPKRIASGIIYHILLLGIGTNINMVMSNFSSHNQRRRTNLISFFCYALCLLIGYNNS